MIWKFSIFAFLIFLTTWQTSLGQNCSDFHKSENCYVYVPLDRDFKIYNQAKSISMIPGKPTVYKIVLYGKKDYIVGVCADAQYYRKISLRIFDGLTRQLLFDNQKFNYIESFGFTVNKTQPIEMEVKIITDEKNKKLPVCVGFQILYSNVIDDIK